ncbi:GDSL-like Lipase/Acylhydrolase family protein [Lyngbya aestuarii BL J]|uniref:GDSL-like Lipase/Acylhydrolase family protein n=1 Tax=Lyngbya aestuarii BL J TaxID=1348334 RepID=U7QCF7_9CYAN|nr:GDSL-type esterase/lipase family protein [Lyngbya aestuarii]ERT04720.1 GDSL-like Lipase/Acylhydrolase family protein [Lyngbya aestuarii BL J]
MSVPKTGLEMYQQRLVALYNKQIYTRLPSNTFTPLSKDWIQIFQEEAQLIKAVITSQSHSTRLAVLLGDSLSMWFPTALLPEGRFWLNQGISGDTTGGILKRLSALDAVEPNEIYILAGINDLKLKTPVPVILKNYQRILQELKNKHPHSQLFVQSLFPTSLPSQFLSFTIPNTQINQFNHELKQLAQQENTNYLDFHSRFANPSGNLHSELTTDGLHLTPAGYQVWQFALTQTESRFAKGRDEKYQKWLQSSPEFQLNGKSYRWSSYQVKPEDTLKTITIKAFGTDEFEYCDLIAIRNQLISDSLDNHQTLEIPTL